VEWLEAGGMTRASNAERRRGDDARAADFGEWMGNNSSKES
jgi:hypothetical protein